MRRPGITDTNTNNRINPGGGNERKSIIAWDEDCNDTNENVAKEQIQRLHKRLSTK